jgi:hypothetical protein
MFGKLGYSESLNHHVNVKHYITLHCIALHYITLHYITLHYITLHYITLHYIVELHLYLHCRQLSEFTHLIFCRLDRSCFQM